MSEKSKETTSRKKVIWKKLRGFLAMVMVAVISIVGTLAYLSRKTDPITNTFTATPDIDVTIDEPGFDPEGAKKYQPGVVYPKNPILKNTTEGNSTDDGEWVVIRVDYLVEDQGTDEDGKTTNTTKYTPWSYEDITNDVTVDNDAKGLINFNAKSKDDNQYIDDKYIEDNPKYTYTTEGIQALPGNTDSNWIRIDKEWLSDEVQDAMDAENTENTTWKSEYYVYRYQLVPGKQDTVATKNTAGSLTSPLFQNVVVKSQEQLIANGYAEAKDTEDEDEDESVLSKLPGFDIVVIGGAIKNSGDTTVTISNGVIDLDKLEDSTSIDNNIVNQLVKLLVKENPTLNKSSNTEDSMGNETSNND